MALSALLLLLPLLLNVQKIPDDAIQLDMNAVYSAISSVDLWKDPRNALAPFDSQLTVPQRALMKMHWVLETIQKEMPEAPPQFDLGLFSDALEAIVEMDEERKEVKLKMDKLNEWAGGQKEAAKVQMAEEEKKQQLEEDRRMKKDEEEKEAKEEEEKKAKEEEEKKAKEEEEKKKQTEKEMLAQKTGKEEAAAEVRVNGDGNIEVKRGAKGEGKMEVKRDRDENGNEVVVVTFVKKETKADNNEQLKEMVDMDTTTKTNIGAEPSMPEQTPKVDIVAESSVPEQTPKVDIVADSSVPAMQTLSSSAGSSEEEADKSGGNVFMEINGRKMPQRIGEIFARNVRENSTIANDKQMQIVTTPRNERDFSDGWFDSPFLSGGGPIGSFLNLFFGRKKRETVVRENVQTLEDGSKIRTMKKLITFGKPGWSGFLTKVVDVAVRMDGDEKQQDQAVNGIVRRNNWTVKQAEADNSTSENAKTESANDNNLMLEKDSEKPKSAGATEENAAREGSVGLMKDDAEQQQEDEKKAEIKQYLEQSVANADGQKKWEKLAFVWYSELLYWTAKWVEALENRMAGVKPQLASQFIFSNTGLAAYKELKDELGKWEEKLAKLKEWIGQYFK